MAMPTTAWGIVQLFLAVASVTWAATMRGFGVKSAFLSNKIKDEGALINTKTTDAVYPIVYGTTRVGGNLVFATTTGIDNKYFHLVLSLGEGELNGIHQDEAVDQIFLNGKLYTESDFVDSFSYEFFSGSATQNVCATLHTAYPDWTDCRRYGAYLYCKFEYDRDKFISIPEVTVILEGSLVKNFETEDDYDSMPEIYTNDLAYCVYDLMTRPSTRGGKEIDPTRIDLPSFRDASAYYTTYGWECNMAVNRDQAIEDNLALLLANGRSEIIYSDSKFKLKFRDTREESVVMQITEDDIIQSGKESTIEISPAATLFNRPNAIKATFISADKNYTQDEKVFRDDDAYATEGDYREQTIELLGLSSLDKVIPMSYYYLERARWGNAVTMIIGNKGISLEPMDLIEITHRMPGWTDAAKPMYRVEGVRINEGGNVGLLLLQEHDDFYNDDYDIDAQDLFVTDLLSPSAAVQSVINVSHSEEVYYYRDRSFTRWKIDFDPPTVEIYPFWDYAEIWLKIGDGGYKFMTKATSDYQLDPVEEGEIYYIKIRSVNIFGVKEDFDAAYIVSKTITGKTDVPSNMLAITATAAGDTVSIYGDEVSDPDVSGYELRLGDSWLGGIFMAFNETPNFRLVGVKPGTFTFWCNPKDNSGNYAATAVSATVTVFYPSGYTDKNTWSWDYDGIGLHDNTEHVIYDAGDCLKCSHGLVTGNLLDENCSDISDWVDADFNTAVSEVSPAGRFRFDTNTGAAGNAYAYRHRDIGSIPAKVTFEIHLYHDAIGTRANNDKFIFKADDGTNCFEVQFCSDGLFVYDGSTYNEVGTNLVKQGGSAEWQIWRFVVTMGSTCDIYLYDSTHDAEKVGTNIDCSDSSGSLNGKIEIAQFGHTTNDMITHIDYVRIQEGLIPVDVLLAGTWISPEYDLGSEKTVRVWGDFLTVFVSSAISWAGIFPDTTKWEDKIDADTRWYELTTPDIAAILEAKIKWGVSSGVYPNEADFFQILSPEFTARYLQVEIKITDPQADANLYVKELNCKAAYWS